MQKVIVIGDIMLDEYIMGESSRLSPEAPVPIVKETNRTYSLGGAGNVFANLKSLGCYTLLLGVIGCDKSGETIRELAQQSYGILINETAPTTVKTRVLANGKQVSRIDKEGMFKICDNEIRYFKSIIDDFKPDAIVVSDYNKGMVTKSLMEEIVKLKNKCVLIGDPKNDMSLFKGFDVITPNDKELLLPYIYQDLEVDNIVRTRGAKGVVLTTPNSWHEIKSIAREVYDVTGAGDVVIAVLTYLLCINYPIYEATCLANLAAGISVGRVGTFPISRDDIREYIYPFNNTKKVEKKWGSETWFANSPLYCGKILNLKKGYICSFHHHEKKDETFYIMSGEVLLTLNNSLRTLRSGDSVRLKPYDRHSFAGIENSVIIEVSTQHFEKDSIRETESGEWNG